MYSLLYYQGISISIKSINEHNTNKNRRGHNFIDVAMGPEALVAATLAVSQERKSFTTNHTSILKIVRFNAQNVAQFDA